MRPLDRDVATVLGYTFLENIGVINVIDYSPGNGNHIQVLKSMDTNRHWSGHHS